MIEVIRVEVEVDVELEIPASACISSLPSMISPPSSRLRSVNAMAAVAGWGRTVKSPESGISGNS
jgi:hypothetical protein